MMPDTSLDNAYANAAYIPGGMDYPAKWQAKAAAYREGMLEQGLADLNITYGPSARQQFDLFLPNHSPKGLVVIVHGGYWLRFNRSDFSHLASGATARGWAVAMPSYDLCPTVRIADITQQVASAITTSSQMVSGPIALAGHSAGGHLVARMLEPALLASSVAARLTHVLPISPVTDLRPLLRTSMNEDFKLDDTRAAAESPVLMQTRLPVPVTLWVGAEERPAFLDQSRWLAEAWGVPEVIAPGRHHFDVIEPLEDPESAMLSRLLG